MKTFIVTCLVVLVGCVSHAPIPEDLRKPMTLGEILDLGGTQVSKDAMLAELMGTTWWFETPAPGEITFRGDGTFTGYIAMSGSRTVGVGIHGTWSVTDDGQMCMQQGSVTNRTDRRCRYLFRLGSDYFTTSSPNDRAEIPARRRQASR